MGKGLLTGQAIKVTASACCRKRKGITVTDSACCEAGCSTQACCRQGADCVCAEATCLAEECEKDPLMPVIMWSRLPTALWQAGNTQ